MSCEKEAVCERLRELEEKVEERFQQQGKRIGQIEVNFAKVETKLNLILTICGAIGTGVVSILLNMVFK